MGLFRIDRIDDDVIVDCYSTIQNVETRRIFGRDKKEAASMLFVLV